MKTAFDGINEKTVTFEADSTVAAGDFAVVSANGKIRKAAANEIPLGIATEVRNGLAAVQLSGYMKVKCDAALPLGFKKVAVNSAGVLAANTAGREAFIIELDTAEGACGILL